MKPHPSIFRAAMDLVNVVPGESLMVGDSVRQDVDGALAAGMRAILLHRGSGSHPLEPELAARDIPIVRSLIDVAQIVS